MKRALALGLLMIAAAANATELAPASARESLGSKPQWAPSGNFPALHARAVFRSETESGSRPYARERAETAAGSGIFLSRDSFEGALNSAPSLHRYAYAHVNPLRYSDPTGHCMGAADCALQHNDQRLLRGEISEQQYLKNTEDFGRAGAAGAAGLVALETAAVAAAWEATAGPLVEATLTVGRGLLARSGVRAALYAASGAIARFGDNIINAFDEGNALATVSGPALRQAERQLGRSADRVVSTTVEELKPPPLAQMSSGTGAGESVVVEVGEAASKEGTWTIRKLQGPNGDTHFTHEVKLTDGTTLETHLVKTKDGKGTLVSEFDPAGRDKKFKLVETSEPIKLKDAPAAQAEQRRLTKDGNQGPFVLEGADVNSCASHGCDVGEIGGAEGLPEHRSQWRPWVYEKTEGAK